MKTEKVRERLREMDRPGMVNEENFDVARHCMLAFLGGCAWMIMTLIGG